MSYKTITKQKSYITITEEEHNQLLASDEIFSQLIRSLMYPNNAKKYNKPTKSIMKISKIILDKYNPQMPPDVIHQTVSLEYHSWIKHYHTFHPDAFDNIIREPCIQIS